MSIDLYRNGENLSADVLNRPISQLYSELTRLSQIVDTLANGYATSSLVPIADGESVARGNLVYLDDKGYARKAKAVWRSSVDVNGIILPADSAYVYGIVSSISGTQAVVVTFGSVPVSPSVIAGLIQDGSQGTEGTWYLSSTVPGKVVREENAGYMKIPVVQITAGASSGLITLTGAKPYAGYHIHAKFTVPADAEWTEESEGRYVYSGDALSDMSFFNWKDAFIQINGVAEFTGTKIKVEESEGSAILVATEDMTGKQVDVFTALPDSYAEPVVRGIRTTGSGRLTASSENGLVTIGVDGWNGVEPAPGYRDRAISQLTDNGGYAMTHIVSGIVTDETLSATEGANGVWNLSHAGGPFLYPLTISLNSATVVNNGGVLYYIFPQGRPSSMTGTINIPKPAEGYHWKAYPFVQAVAGSVSVSCTLSILKRGEFDDAGDAPEELEDTQSISAVAGTGSMLKKSDEGWTVEDASTAWLALSADGTVAYDMNVTSFGLYLEAEEDED